MKLSELRHRNDLTIKRPKVAIIDGQETVKEWMCRTSKKPEQIEQGVSSFQKLIDNRYGK